jgi:hypothetical protein
MRKHRIWQSFTSLPLNNPICFDTAIDRQRHVMGFVELFNTKVTDGWQPYFLTFKYRQLSGPQRAVLQQMRTGIQLFYRRLATRVQRNPIKGPLPILMTAADLPVSKHSKVSIFDVTTNDGLHQHGILLTPAKSRLRENFVAHLYRMERQYIAGSPLSSIYAEPVTHDLERAVRYALKAFESGRLGYDESILWLPQARSELSRR